jgi:ABC-type transport system substrate-binding protein
LAGGGGLYPQYWESFHSDNANKPQTNNLFNVADKELDSLIDAYNVEFDMDKRAALSTRSSSASMISPSSCPAFSSTTCEPAAGAM